MRRMLKKMDCRMDKLPLDNYKNVTIFNSASISIRRKKKLKLE